MFEGKRQQSSRFCLILIKPSHYDDDGYVIQWARSAIPSNTLATLYALAMDSHQRNLLGIDTDIDIDAHDETNTHINPSRIIRRIRRAGGRGMVCFVGVQSNQFPHTLDLARPLREAGIQVCIGGFHVSGCLSMLPEIPYDIGEALDLGISIFAGEAEGRFDEVLKDADKGQLKPIYNYLADLPNLDGAPTPILPPSTIKRTGGALTSFDSGRGCPFQCSFCTIINVQGRKSRYRSADDIEKIIRLNAANGINSYFITDDNFARNKNWEAIFDRLIYLREEQGFRFKFVMQVDTLCHQIPGFIDKAARAGCARVFLGLESINPENLIAVKKRQNRITEYRIMLQAWKNHRVITYCGYILGFPADMPESIRRDIAIIQRELPVDLLEFFCLTPLPGSEDHKTLMEKQVPMDPDMNKYDLEHVTTAHPKMSQEEWAGIYDDVWEVFYTPEHVETILKRAAAKRISIGKTLFLIIWFYGCKTIEGVHPLEGGYLRRKSRRDRRPGLPLESPFVFYPRYAFELVSKHLRFLALILRYGRIRARLKRDPAATNYTDTALTPVTEEQEENLEMFTTSQAARDTLSNKRGRESLRQSVGTS